MVNQKTINADAATAASNDESVRLDQLDTFAREIGSHIAAAKNHAQEASDLADRLKLVLGARRNSMMRKAIRYSDRFAIVPKRRASKD